MRHFITATLYLIFFVASGLKAQNVMLFTSKEGLSNSRIRNIYEDSNNNIWITTQNGLNRYDGVKMNVYRHKDGDVTSLMHDESTCVEEYDKDHVLVGTGQGLQLFTYATGLFQEIPFLSLQGDTIHGRVMSAFRLNGNRILVSFSGYGLGELKKNTDGCLILQPTNEFTVDRETPIQLMKDKNILWMVGSSHNLYRWNGKKPVQYKNLKGVRKLALSTSGQLYAATENDGLFVYDKDADHFNCVATHNDVVGVISGLNPWTGGRMLIPTDGGGLRVYDENTGQTSSSQIRTNDIDLESDNVKDAISDKYGNVWVGVYWKGVLMKPVNQSAFEYIGHHSITKNVIGDESIFAIVADPYNNSLWVAPDNDGLYLIAPDGASSRHWGQEQNPDMPHGFTAVMPHSPSILLLGTFTDGLWQMRDGRFSLMTKDINQIFDIKPARKEGIYWIATMGGGFYYFDYEKATMVNYAPDWSRGDEGAKIIGNSYVYRIIPLDSQLFVATSDGLTICKLEQDERIVKPSDKLLSGSSVHNMAVSPDGKYMWLATNSGLVRVDVKSHDTKIFTTEEGLPINNVESIFADGGHLWIGTDMGLSLMDVKGEGFTNFYATDGLQDNEFNPAAVASLAGNIYLGGIGGITYFNAREMESWQQSESRFHLRLVDVLVGGRLVHAGDRSGRYQILDGLINETGRIDLSHRDNHFIIELGVSELTGQDVIYEYCVNGGKWVSQGDNNRIIFDNLESGTYRVRVRALVLGKLTEEREFLAVVHPAWYASVGAKIFYLLIFLTLCWFIYEYIKRRIEDRKALTKQKQQEEFNEARIRFFMNISHEIRTPMTLIMSPLNKLITTDSDSERQHNYQLIKQNSNRILRLVNQMMDARKIEQGKFLLKYKKVEMVGFLQNIFDVFATNAQSRSIDYQFVHEPGSFDAYVDPDNMDKVMMNLLSNAFKFTPDGGKITLDFTASGDQFGIKVTDNGVGIPHEDKAKVFDRFYSASSQDGYVGTGIGLNLTSMLVKLHKGTIVAEDNPDEHGAQFVITMPVGNGELTDGSIIPDKNTDKVEQEIAELLPIDKPADTHRKNVVLVEDDEAIRQYVHSELSKDVVIHTCSNGQEAWDYVISHLGKVDLVISDIMMPVMDGLTLCQKIKSNFNTNHIPVVLMTALGSDSDKIAGLTNGADAYVTKPFNIDVLKTVVLQQLKTRHLLQGKFHGDRQQEEKIDRVEVESPDENLMRRVMKVINEELANPDLSVEMIADKVGISRVHFYRKMKDLTGQAPRDFLKYVRLKEAARLLKEKKMDITGVSIATGFKSLSAFSTNFKSLYGLPPTEWAKNR